jgi:hypothetical protein
LFYEELSLIFTQLSTRQLVIATPNHPAPFPPDLDCFWLLKAPPGGHVHLQFFGDRFFYGCDDTCDKTFVELKTGPDFRVTGYRLVFTQDLKKKREKELLLLFNQFLLLHCPGGLFSFSGT